VRYRRLGPAGPEVSELGFGASPLGGIYGTFAEQDGIAAVHTALDAGINFLDVSPYYGLTAAETILGKALRGIGRDRYVLATKAGRCGDEEFDFTAAGVTRSVHDSLARLGAGHIDLIQCHDIEFGSLDQVVHESLPALRELQRQGLVRWIGVTGYPLPALLAVARRAPVDTVMSYCQYTLQDRRLAARAADFTATGAALISASPLAMGALTDRGAPAWHPAPPEVLRRCGQAAAVCRERGASLAKLALQFSVTTSPAATTVVGSASANHVRRDIAALAGLIDPDLLTAVEAILAPVRDVGWVNGRPENQDPGPLP
jgi:aryl-alcohol dehydrogenase-like predicted oxidoreductase